MTNNGTAAVERAARRQPGPNLVELDTRLGHASQPGQTVNHDFVAAVDTFGSGRPCRP